MQRMGSRVFMNKTRCCVIPARRMASQAFKFHKLSVLRSNEMAEWHNDDKSCFQRNIILA